MIVPTVSRGRPRCRPAVLLLLGLALVAGCGGTPGLVSVSGVVTVDGQPPPAPVTLRFLPVEVFGDFPRASGTGVTSASGSFTVSAGGDRPGLYPGLYSVTAQCWKVPPTMGGPPEVSHIAPKYARTRTSGIELRIEQGTTDPLRLSYDLQGPRN